MGTEMGVLKNVLVLATCAACCSCASPQAQWHAPDGMPYVEPANDTSATIIGSLETIFFDGIRARVESIDSQWVPVGPREPIPVRLLSGSHTVAAICETEHGSGEARASLVVQVQLGHSYVLRCKEKSLLINIGTKFWIEDQSAESSIVSKAEGWGASHGPTGKVL